MTFVDDVADQLADELGAVAGGMVQAAHPVTRRKATTRIDDKAEVLCGRRV